jgi:hypothetical protein
MSAKSPKDTVVPVLAWRKSRRSVGNGACVEVAPDAPAILLRDSVDPEGPMLRCAGRAWRAFIADMKQ